MEIIKLLTGLSSQLGFLDTIIESPGPRATASATPTQAQIMLPEAIMLALEQLRQDQIQLRHLLTNLVMRLTG